MGMSKGVSDALTSETPFSLAAYTDLVQKIISLYIQEDFASVEASKGLCGRPLQSFALHPCIRLE